MGFQRIRVLASFLLLFVLVMLPAAAQKKYDPGASDTEVKVGNFVPYTGKFSEYGATGLAEAAYFKMINDAGGINGRKITFISLDSKSDFAGSLALARQLVEKDQVLLTVGTWGAPANLSIRPYMNEKKVPQLFVADTNAAMNDSRHFPWTMGFQATKEEEGTAYAKYILQNKPGAKIAILSGAAKTDQGWSDGVHQGLGSKAASMIVKEISLTSSDPGAMGPAIRALKDSGANVFFNLTEGRYCTEAIRQAFDLGWHPLQFIPNASLSIKAFLEPAGLTKATGIISNARSKGWLKPDEQQDPEVAAFVQWMAKYNPQASLRDANYVYGYEVAQTLAEVVKRCGDNLTRANVMQQASNLDLRLGMLRQGIKITTSPTDYRPIKQLFLIQFDGADWQALGPVQGY